MNDVDSPQRTTLTDGIEGCIHPLEGERAPGAVALYRGYRGSSTADDWAIFPSTELISMNGQGYVTDGSLQKTGVIGYAYLNTGPRPTY
jgi:hypothetical protein